MAFKIYLILISLLTFSTCLPMEQNESYFDKLPADIIAEIMVYAIKDDNSNSGISESDYFHLSQVNKKVNGVVKSNFVHKALQKNCEAKLDELMTEYGQDKNYYPVLYGALKSDNIYFIKNKFKPEELNNPTIMFDYSMLYWAVYWNSKKTVKWLLKHKLDSELINIALHRVLTVVNPDFQIIDLLLDAGANAESVDRDNLSFLDKTKAIKGRCRSEMFRFLKKRKLM